MASIVGVVLVAGGGGLAAYWARVLQRRPKEFEPGIVQSQGVSASRGTCRAVHVPLPDLPFAEARRTTLWPAEPASVMGGRATRDLRRRTCRRRLRFRVSARLPASRFQSLGNMCQGHRVR